MNIVLRLDPQHRDSFEDVRNAYVTSPITHASVPLRSVADLQPQWQHSRIVRRNGVRTLTVRAFPRQGHYASEILKAVDPKIRSLALPTGYRTEYGGERTNTDETMPAMQAALAISLVAIFLVLLVQFRTLSDPLVVMSSIPLTLFGAMLGLVLTHYPFGFTAFMGLISLSGIVVRNAIILVDYIKEKQRDGRSLEQAATEAGERRLRPIFLTTMAAARGRQSDDSFRVELVGSPSERDRGGADLFDVLHPDRGPSLVCAREVAPVQAVGSRSGRNHPRTGPLCGTDACRAPQTDPAGSHRHRA